MPARYRRILLKLSGELLAGEAGHGVSDDVLVALAEEIGAVRERGVEIGIVLGGGNIFRGIAGSTRWKSAATTRA